MQRRSMRGAADGPRWLPRAKVRRDRCAASHLGWRRPVRPPAQCARIRAHCSHVTYRVGSAEQDGAGFGGV